MSRSPVLFLVLSLLFAFTAAAQNADLTLSLAPDARYNAGERAMVKATVTNLGPDTATAAGVRLTKPAQKFAGAALAGCTEFADEVLCNTPSLKAGESHDFLVPFVPPDDAGTMNLAARTESFTVDPNHTNDAATATADVVALPDLKVTVLQDSSFRPGARATRVYVTVTSLAAARPDSVSVLVTIPEPLVPAQQYPYCDEVEGAAPETYRCTLANFAQYGSWTIYLDVLASHPSPPVEITASIEGSAPDWNPADNQAALVAPVFDVHDLDIRMSSAEELDANNNATAEFRFANTSDAPAVNVSAEVITYPGDPDASAAGDGWTCAPSSTYRLMCTRDSIAPHATTVLRLPVHYAKHEFRGAFAANVTQKPSPDFRMFAQPASIQWVFYRPYFVTNVEDSGPGSLRQAILDANAECSADDSVPCAIRFAIPAPVPAEGWFTITPRSALPVVTVTDFAIDGESQTGITGDTNKRVYLFGGQAGDADGLSLNTAAATVRGLAIGGFAHNGIFANPRFFLFSPRRHVVENNYIGTDPTGDLAVPNGLRGVMAYRFEGEIAGNVISGNSRSGVFLDLSPSAAIHDNRFGVAAHSDASLGNGASAIYVGGHGTITVEHNVIANSGDFGVAVERFSAARVLENRIFGNVQTGIDLGLDGPTLDGTPQITSARFDFGTGETVIEGVIPRPRIRYALVTWTAYVYANSRDDAAGEIFLGAIPVDTDGRFTLRYAGDLRGKFIDATLFEKLDFGDGFTEEGSSEFGPRRLLAAAPGGKQRAIR